MTKTRTAGQVGVGALALGLVLAALLAMSMMLAASKSAHADTTFTVNSTVDPGNGVCDFSCTLREAITAANNTPGRDTIRFNIFGSGVRTISPDTKLPAITEALTIDGYTQTGASPNTKARGTNAQLMVELDGSLLESPAGFGQNGLSITADDVVVRGLVINRFDDGNGIVVFGDSPTGVKVEGNFIGTDASGTQDLGNSAGVVISGSDGSNTVGGVSPDDRNLISANDDEGVLLLSEDNKVQGNLIGTGKDGAADLGNDGDGVALESVTGNIVGGGEANIIAFNGSDGVEVGDSDGPATGNRILGNSIFSNDSLGIDLAGATANDPADADTGANDLQNFPVLTLAERDAGKTTIEGKLKSTPNKQYTVQLFSNPQGQDEGETFVGQVKVTTDAQGKASFTFESTQPRSDQNITATATDKSAKNTSEFSAPKTVVAR